MKLKKFMSLILCFAMVFSTMSFNVFASEEYPSENWINNADTSWFSKGEPYVISNAIELAGLAKLVNEGTAFCNKDFNTATITLGNDIDLKGKMWTPIGGGENNRTFVGVFEGNNKTISNMVVISSYDNVGLFGRCAENADFGVSAKIKNLTVENAIVKATGKDGVSAISGYGHTELTIENVNVTGTIDILGYRGVAGIVGKGYPDIYNSTLTAEGRIASQYWCSGGILGHSDEPCVIIDNCKVIGVGNGLIIDGGSYNGAGGIAGYIASESIVRNCVVQNISIDGESYYYGGYICGNGKASENSKIINVKFLVNGEISNEAHDSETVTSPVAEVNGVKYMDIHEAIAVGGDIALLTDIKLEKTITVKKDACLELNGYTISGTCNASQAHMFMVNNGVELTIKDSSNAKTGRITYNGTDATGWIIDVEGMLVLESGTLELTGTWGIGYAVDVRPNAWGTAYTEETSFVMNGGKIISSDGAVRVASSSSDTYKDISASFTMNGGEIEAAWDGIFVQQSNAAWDVLNVTINNGTIKSDLNPVRFYGPAATSYVNGEDCVDIALNGGTLTYTGAEAREWLVDGILRIGGGVTADNFIKDSSVTASAAFAEANVAKGYKWVETDGVYTLEEDINLPTATVTEIENENLTFALNFKADDASDTQLSYYGNWYADFVLTVNKDVTFNANGGADGYLSGQYDVWSENWVNVPFENVTIKADEPLKIMEYAATLMGQPGLKLTYNDVYSFVKDFDCGVFFEEEFLAANPDLEVTLELRMYNNEDESESYTIGQTYKFRLENNEDLRMFSLASAYVDYLPISLYPDNIKLYRLGLYSAAEGMDYDEYGFEVIVDGQEPVMIKAEKYDGEIMLRVGMDRIDNLKPVDFNYNGSNNVCIFGQTIAFDESAVGEGKVKFRPYVVIDGKTYWGYTFTAPNIYTK